MFGVSTDSHLDSDGNVGSATRPGNPCARWAAADLPLVGNIGAEGLEAHRVRPPPASEPGTDRFSRDLTGSTGLGILDGLQVGCAVSGTASGTRARPELPPVATAGAARAPRITNTSGNSRARLMPIDAEIHPITAGPASIPR